METCKLKFIYFSYSGWFYDDKRHGKGVLTIIKDNLQFKGHF